VQPLDLVDAITRLVEHVVELFFGDHLLCGPEEEDRVGSDVVPGLSHQPRADTHSGGTYVYRDNLDDISSKPI
jgi:hypothetical protein